MDNFWFRLAMKLYQVVLYKLNRIDSKLAAIGSQLDELGDLTTEDDLVVKATKIVEEAKQRIPDRKVPPQQPQQPQ